MNNNKILNASKNFFEEDEFAFEIEEPQNSLLVGWKWIGYNDASGHLESPSGKSYFCYDWATTEYRKTLKSPYSLWGTRTDDGIPITFADFQKYAEEYTVKNYLKLENVKDEYEEHER